MIETPRQRLVKTKQRKHCLRGIISMTKKASLEKKLKNIKYEIEN